MTVAVAATLCAVPGTAVADGETAPTPILVPGSDTSGPADPYPSVIAIPEGGPVTDVDLTLYGVEHTFPADIEVLLVGPSGVAVTVMSNAGDGTGVSGVDLTFDDEAAAAIPDTAPIATGTFRPTNGIGFGGFYPAPDPPYESTLAAFDGSPSAGDWQLFVYDSGDDDVGTIAGGWSLRLSSLAGITIDGFSPVSGRPGGELAILGSGFTGVTDVAVGDTALEAFTVSSDLWITAVLPDDVTSGPIQIEGPLGTAISDVSFSVIRDRTVVLHASRLGARGRLRALGDTTACSAGVTVSLQERGQRGWRTLARIRTRADGTFRWIDRLRPAAYRAVAAKATAEGGDVCLRAASAIVAVRPPR